MKAWILESPAPIETHPLKQVELSDPQVQPGQVRIRTKVCGVCLTDLHVCEGDLPFKHPVIPGHQVIGRIDQVGEGVTEWRKGDYAGVAWLHEACGKCRFCQRQAENLCESARFTGYDAQGGFAEYIIAPSEFVYPIPATLASAAGAPLLCAGIIGYRSLRICGAQSGGRLGLYGFGASAHISIQIARHWGCETYVFTRSKEHRRLALDLGAKWAGRAEDEPPAKLDSAIIFAPAGDLIPEALRVLDWGGSLALAGIHMSPTPALYYREHLYYERRIQSVTNNTREDGRQLFEIAAAIPIQTHTQIFPVEDVNQVLQQVKNGGINGAAVLEF